MAANGACSLSGAGVDHSAHSLAVKFRSMPQPPTGMAIGTRAKRQADTDSDKWCKVCYNIGEKKRPVATREFNLCDVMQEWTVVIRGVGLRDVEVNGDI